MPFRLWRYLSGHQYAQSARFRPIVLYSVFNFVLDILEQNTNPFNSKAMYFAAFQQLLMCSDHGEQSHHYRQLISS